MGVEDEQTGELTLHESGHAYALRQSVGARQDSVEDHAMEGLEWKQRKDALVNQFGSKKKKAAIRCGGGGCRGGGSSAGDAGDAGGGVVWSHGVVWQPEEPCHQVRLGWVSWWW